LLELRPDHQLYRGDVSHTNDTAATTTTTNIVINAYTGAFNFTPLPFTDIQNIRTRLTLSLQSQTVILRKVPLAKTLQMFYHHFNKAKNKG
jgi:hypothetical protein